MLVSDILNHKGRDVVTVSPGDTLEAIVNLLTRRRIGAVVVTEGEDVVGILSERDIVRCLAAHGAGALSRKAEDAMTRDVMTCGEDDRIEEIMARMTEGRFRHMPVRKEGRLLGLVSIGDVVKARLEEYERDAQALRDYIATA